MPAKIPRPKFSVSSLFVSAASVKPFSMVESFKLMWSVLEELSSVELPFSNLMLNEFIYLPFD